jgi:8-oxo-dGTP pyrophosphatase MutT (NUDIX family)
LEKLVNHLKSAFNKELPGEKAQFMMAPLKRGGHYEPALEANYMACAVMILICFDEQEQPYIPLTERMTYNGHHSGQVSLPGGKFDATDADLQHTAVRECFEEIGVSNLEVIGKLSRLFIPVSGYRVDPYVAFSRDKNVQLNLHVREVKNIIRLKITDLLDDSIVKEGLIEVSGTTINAPWFEVDGYKVWGATAMMLNELKMMLKAI